MEGVGEGQNLATGLVQTGELECGFVGFGARVRKERSNRLVVPFLREDLLNLLSKLHLWLRGKEIGDMAER